MVRRIAFLSGLILGSGLLSWILGSALTFLLTGRIPSLRLDGRQVRLELIDINTLYEAPMLVPEAQVEASERGGAYGEA